LSFCSGRALLGLDCSPENFIKKIKRVTLEDIKKAAGKITLKSEFFLAAQGGEAVRDD
jgi:predicted Zn-dependent peptidase